MGCLAELPDQMLEPCPTGNEQPGVAGASGEGEQPPAQAVVEALGIAVDEPGLGKSLQGPRHLALLAADELGDAHDAEAPVRRRLLTAEGQEDLEAAPKAGLMPDLRLFLPVLGDHGCDGA